MLFTYRIYDEFLQLSLLNAQETFFGIPCREKSGNLSRIKVELTKQGKVLQGTIISMFYSNFSIVE
jgi:hypothetical protein